MMLRKTFLAFLCLAACGLMAQAEEKLQPLTTTIEVAKRPPEPQPTVALGISPWSSSWMGRRRRPRTTILALRPSLSRRSIAASGNSSRAIR